MILTSAMIDQRLSDWRNGVRSDYKVGKIEVATLPKNIGHVRAKYPWESLEVTPGELRDGPSFLVSCTEENINRLWSTLSGSARCFEARTGTKFTMRRVNSGIRVWRVK